MRLLGRRVLPHDYAGKEEVIGGRADGVAGFGDGVGEVGVTTLPGVQAWQSATKGRIHDGMKGCSSMCMMEFVLGRRAWTWAALVAQ